MALTARVDIRPTTHYTAFDFRGSNGSFVTGLEIDGLTTIGIGVYDDAEKYAAIGALVDALEGIRKGIARRMADAVADDASLYTESELAAMWGR